MRRLPFPPLLVTLLVAVLAGCYLFPKEEKVLAPPLMTAPEVQYTTIDATKGSITSKTSVLGDFVSVTQTPLFFRSGGNRLKRIAVTLGDVVKPGTLVAELDTGPLENRVAQQKVLLRKTQVINDRTVVLGRDRFEKELAALDVELATLQLQEVQARLDESRLVTPVGGTVVFVARAAPGDLVDGYSTVVIVADPGNLQLVYKGDSAGDFPVGAKVSVQIFDGKTYTGDVVMAPGSMPADASEDLRKSVVVRVPGLPSKVKIGDSGTLTRVLAHRDNVIVIPRDVVHTYLGRDFVQVLENGQMKEKTIELGVQTVTEVEVLSGLKAGEKILSQ